MSSSTLSLADALLEYEQRNLEWPERLRRLQLDFGMRMGKTALAKLNKQFRIGSVKPAAATEQPPQSKPQQQQQHRLSLIADELVSHRKTRPRKSENDLPTRRHSLFPDDARVKRPLLDTPLPRSTVEIFQHSIHDRWWYAQHADLRLELDELKAGFAVEVLKKQKHKSLGTKRRAFADLSRPTSENVSDTL